MAIREWEWYFLNMLVIFLKSFLILEMQFLCYQISFEWEQLQKNLISKDAKYVEHPQTIIFL